MIIKIFRTVGRLDLRAVFLFLNRVNKCFRLIHNEKIWMQHFNVLNLAFENLYKIEKKMRCFETHRSEIDGADLERVIKRYSKLTEEFEVKGGYEIKD